MVPGGIRNIHEGKVSGQMANAANHHSDRHGTEDYMNIVHRLSNEVRARQAQRRSKIWWCCPSKTIFVYQCRCVTHSATFAMKPSVKLVLTAATSLLLQEGDSAMRNPSFPLRSPQPGCSPAGSEGTPKRKHAASGKGAIHLPDLFYSFRENLQALTRSYSVFRLLLSFFNSRHWRINVLCLVSLPQLALVPRWSCSHRPPMHPHPEMEDPTRSCSSSRGRRPRWWRRRKICTTS